MQEPLTAQTITENQRNLLSVALLNSERNVALLNHALAIANAHIAELQAAKGVNAIPDHLKKFAGGPPYEQSNEHVGNGKDT
jgi:hypothetical protein